MHPPTARKIPHFHFEHGQTRDDPYYWLRERDNPEVIAHLNAENAYLEELTEPIKALQEKLYNKMLSHIQQTDLEVPVQHGPYFYYWRSQEGLQYRIYCRKRAAGREGLDEAAEQVVLDLNQLAAGKEFFSVSLTRPSPDHKLLAYLQNQDGSDRYRVQVLNLETGELLPDRMDGVFSQGSLEWDASGQYLFYVLVDDAQRPARLYRHQLGAAPFTDPLLYQESDETFRLVIEQSNSGEFLFAISYSTLTSEVRYLPSNSPLDPWRLFAPRIRGIQYTLEHHRSHFYILTNQDAQNFKLLYTPTQEPGRQHWQELIPQRPQVYLKSIHPFARHLLIEGREGGLTQLWVHRFDTGQTRQLTLEEPVYTLTLGDNRVFDSDSILVHYQSLVTPRQVMQLELNTLQTSVLKQDPVPGYDPSLYTSERIWARARDGTAVPISLVYKGRRGPAPLYLYGYGSYGYSLDPTFNSNRLALLDQGVIFAMAHVRGGAEMGRGWYEDGKLLKKKNTFGDFIDCAEHLVQSGYTSPSLLAAGGGSAGGLLMGAVINMRPDLFKAVVAQVPFVDVMTTMFDASIPLTTSEYDEWGNPTDPEYYAYMKSYSPYDNVKAKAYPHLLVTAGLNDPRVGYFEPAKWVARLREHKTDTNTLLFKIHMGAGHGGSSGRYDRLREIALEYAFVLDKLGWWVGSEQWHYNAR
jgi:oligopeptidase B